MPPYRQRVVAPPARPAGRFARGAAPPLWQSAGFGSVGCPPPPYAPCAASARLGLALAAPPFSVGAWLRGGSGRGNEGFRRLRAAGERHPSWVSRAHSSLPLQKTYHFIDSLGAPPGREVLRLLCSLQLEGTAGQESSIRSLSSAFPVPALNCSISVSTVMPARREPETSSTILPSAIISVRVPSSNA